MEIEDPQTRETAWKRISSLTSSMNLPFRQWLPSLDWIRARFPNFPRSLGGFQPNWIILMRAFALLFVLTLAYLVFFTGLVRFRHRGQSGSYFAEEDVRSHVQGRINETRIRENLRHVTQWDHIAGTQGAYYLAKWIESEMSAAGLDEARMEEFQVYLNYPKKDGRSVSIISPDDKKWTAKLEEEKAYEDRQQTLVFHGHSKSGTVTGPLIYANYGSREDFETLEKFGVSANGSIALVRYFGSQTDRALKVKAAELAGAIGCIIYSDPDEDGFVKGPPFPDGRFRPADGVQRGTVALTSWIAGDPLTPGYASLPSEDNRQPKESSPALNKIPSIPLAWRDAQVLLQSLKGHGQPLSNQSWKGGVPDVEWWTGDQKSPVVKLQNEQDEVERQPIYNVLGKIEGMEQKEKSVIIGNHYDAWSFGAVDPGSGTAVLLEITRVLGELMKYGWRPRRTIEFAVWDAEEYNLVGSTEHVEARLDQLRKDGYAYVNVDVAVAGPNFTAAASPIYERALTRVLKRTADPQTGRTLHDLWTERGSSIGSLGAGSDYLAFQDFAGVSSIDITFAGEPFPYHSAYDNFEWMESFGDPGFKYHKLAAQALALLVLEMADEAIVPFDLNAYAREVQVYVEELEDYMIDTLNDEKDNADRETKEQELGKVKLDFGPLYNASSLFVANARKFHDWDAAWAGAYDGTGIPEGDAAAMERIRRNDKMAAFESDLVDAEHGVSYDPFFPYSPYTHFLTNASTVTRQRAVQAHPLRAAAVVRLRRRLLPRAEGRRCSEELAAGAERAEARGGRAEESGGGAAQVKTEGLLLHGFSGGIF